MRPRSIALLRHRLGAGACGIDPCSSMCSTSRSVARPRPRSQGTPRSTSCVSSRGVQLQRSPVVRALRDAPHQLVHSCSARGRTSSSLRPVTREPHATVDVEADAARRDRHRRRRASRRRRRWGSRSPSGCRASPGWPHDPRQRRDVRHLLQRLRVDTAFEGGPRERTRCRARASSPSGGDAVDVRLDPFQSFEVHAPHRPSSSDRTLVAALSHVQDDEPFPAVGVWRRASRCRVAAFTPPQTACRAGSSSSPDARATRCVSSSSSDLEVGKQGAARLEPVDELVDPGGEEQLAVVCIHPHVFGRGLGDRHRVADQREHGLGRLLEHALGSGAQARIATSAV